MGEIGRSIPQFYTSGGIIYQLFRIRHHTPTVKIENFYKSKTADQETANILNLRWSNVADAVAILWYKKFVSETLIEPQILYYIL